MYVHSMKKILLLILMICTCSLQAQDMKSLFIAMPDSLAPLLTKVNKEDFGDFLASNMKAEVKNRLGKNSEMLKLTADYLNLKMSESSEVQMKLLPVNDSVKVVCVVHTYKGPAADSSIRFYSIQWEELPLSSYLTLPKEDAFYKAPVAEADQETYYNLRKQADMYLFVAKLSEKDNTLLYSYTTPDYLDKETAEKLKPFLNAEPLKYIWTGEGRFEAAK